MTYMSLYSLSQYFSLIFGLFFPFSLFFSSLPLSLYRDKWVQKETKTDACVCMMIIFQLKWVSKIVLRQRVYNNLGGISYMNFIKGKFLYSVLQINAEFCTRLLNLDT